MSHILSQAFIINFCALRLLLLKSTIMKLTKISLKNIFIRKDQIVIQLYYKLN